MFSFPVFFSARIVHPPMKEVKLNVAQIQTVSISFHGDRSEEARRTPVSELLEFIENVKRHNGIAVFRCFFSGLNGASQKITKRPVASSST
jgi:pyridoxal/pyridoxine/pyridoxamine kinase